MSPLGFDRKEEPRGDIIIRVLMILVIIISLPAISTLQLPPKVMAQTPSEAVRVLVDDVIQALKANDIKKANVHLSLLNQQLSSLGNSSSVQPVVKVLVDDTTSALKNGDINKAILHLELIQQQFGNKASMNQTNLIPKD
jgi:outer membrane protein assembly factor BamD (BamD/ComL family)